MTNTVGYGHSCIEEIHFFTIKHSNHLSMNEKIVEEIEKVPFIRNKKMIDNTDTNIRALQVYNNDIESPTISLLKKWILTIVNDEWITYKISSYWLAKYGKGDYAISHHHIPASYAFIYFIRSPIGSSPLVFSTSDTIIEPEEGKLIIFPGNLFHHVPKNECDGRIVFSGNIIPDMDSL